MPSTSNTSDASQFVLTRLPPMVIVDNYNNSIISHYIQSPVLQAELISISQDLAISTDTSWSVYTDGSLDLNKVDLQDRVIMEAGWAIKDTILTFFCGISYHPSSTRPELLAILMALLALPIGCIAKIFIDSQAATINGIRILIIED